MTATGSMNEQAAAALVEELGRAGVREVCVSPGARSTPLAIALSRDSRVRSWVITDERTSAFFAIGAALASGRPTAVVCTSGTAAANFLPAVVEAYWSEVPLVVLTADRPPELRDCGAPQTIRQDNLFGRHVKWAAEVVAPGNDAPAVRHARAMACRAVATAMAEPRGPVHLNLPYREPLFGDQSWSATDAPESAGAPFTAVTLPRLVADDTAIEAFVATAHGARGLIVAGPRTPTAAVEPVVALAGKLGWPIFADPLSGLRHGAHDRYRVVDAYDVLLRDTEFCHRHQPEFVLRFGAQPTSKPLNRFLAGYGGEQCLVTTSSVWVDPDLALRRVILGDAADFCRRLVDALPVNAATSPVWSNGWIEASTTVRNELNRLVAAEPGRFEGALAARLIDALPDEALLMVGNSMPVRDLDTFAGATGKHLRILANRGANGIDGVLSTALGMAAVHPRPCYLLLGDVSFLHDIGALQIAARHQLELCVVVANNDGGGIFSYLPQAGLGEAFEPFFGTPHGLTFAEAARMCGSDYQLIHNLDDLPTVLRARPGGRILEVPTWREHNVTRSRSLVARAFDAWRRDTARVGGDKR